MKSRKGPGPSKPLEQERDIFFNHSIDLLAIVGTDGYFKRLNPAFERVLGYSVEELCAKPIIEFLHPDDIAKTRKGIEVLSSGVARVTSENRYRCKDGSYKWFSWNTTPMGAELYTVGRDITEKKNSEERIRQLNLELERRNVDLEKAVQERVAELQSSEAQVQQLQKMDAIGRLAGGVAHDFNNILGAITMYCDLLADDAANPELLREHIKEIRQVTERGAGLTRQLLVFSRKQIIQPQIVYLNPLIDQLKKMLARLIGEHVEIVTKLATDLGPVRVDPGQMEQVLMNLVVNARDAMQNGGKITIETANVNLDEEFTSTHLTVEPGRYALLSVADTGCGMDGATLSKIFEPFFTTKPVGKGTGLGLTTTYGIVKQSNGTIWVYSEPGKGTVFKVYLPLVDGVVKEPGVEPIRIPELVVNHTILLVEDDQRLRDGFSRMLRKRGYEVLTASDGESALRILESHGSPIHLLLTDVVMPGLSGFELAKRATASCNGLRVLYMSGYTSDALETSDTDFTGQMPYIQKPFSTTALVNKVRDVLSE